ncbi:MAG TPA: VWA domain-containing protein [Ardenticatenaceae bacterium]
MPAPLNKVGGAGNCFSLGGSVRHWIAVVLIGLLLLVMGTGAFATWKVARPAIAGPFSRTVEPRVVWGSGEAEVVLRFNPTTLPVCQPMQRAADIVLLVDSSGSMQGERYQQALVAAKTFVNEVDLDANQVSIVYFSDVPRLAQGLTADVARLEQALDTSLIGNGTEIGAALRAAGSQLAGPGVRQDSQRVAVLLSDGGASQEADARAAADALKGTGTRIITITLAGDPVSSSLMRELASSPGDAHTSSQASDLVTIYGSIAGALNEAAAFDVRIQESGTSGGLSVVPDSVVPGAELGTMGVQWTLASLPEKASMFRYRVRTDDVGLHDLAVNTGEASARDCQGGQPRWSLPTGPSLLVLPPLGWLLLPLLLLLLPFFAFWNRKKTTQPAAPPARPAAPTSSPPAPPSDGTPAWLKGLNVEARLATDALDVEDSTLQNTILIGCGPAGREVLSEIAQVLRSRFGGRVPVNVRLLQIDVQLEGTPGQLPLPPGLEETQRVVLRPNLEEVRRNLERRPQDFAHWKWYDRASPGYDRARGRMALFYDMLNGSSGSNAWAAIRRAVGDLPAPRVRLVGTTFDDVSSGMLVDVARLVQIVANRNLDAELWLAGPMGRPWTARLHDPRQRLSPEEQEARTAATFRELSRFQRNRPMRFVYAPPSTGQMELRDKATAVVQSLFLFQPRAGAAPESVMATMAECLLALLHTSVNASMQTLLATNTVRASKRRNEGNGVVSAIGCYAFRLPTQALTEAMKWRLLHELLFDAEAGLVPHERLQADGSYKPLAENDAAREVDEAALRRDAGLVVERYAAASHNLEAPGFREIVRQKLEAILNGEDNMAPRPSNGLARARAWLEGAQASARAKRASQLADQLEDFIEEIESWERWFRESVFKESKRRWEASRQPLIELRMDQTTRGTMLDEALEWPDYRTKVRSTQGRVSGLGEPLGRAGRRLGWQVESNGRGWTLRLLVAPPDFVWAPNADIDEFAVDRVGAGETLLQRLERVCEPLVRLRNDVSALQEVVRKANKEEWLRQAAPALRYDRSTASDEMGGIHEQAVLVGPSGLDMEEVEAQLRGHEARLSLSAMSTGDRTVVALLRMVDWIPLNQLEDYREQWSQRRVQPQLHVWRAEQAAAELEGEDEGVKISPDFISLLGADEETVELFATAYMYDVAKQENGGYSLPGLGVVPGTPTEIVTELVNNPPNAFKGTRDAVLRAWQEAIRTRRAEIRSQRLTYFKRALEEKVVPLERSSNSQERAFGSYLRGVVTYLRNQDELGK